jgi:23S rRNA pseudouridine1911/1915/1917 synthase
VTSRHKPPQAPWSDARSGKLSSAAKDELPQNFAVGAADAGRRLDQFLASHLEDVSRVRVQQLIEQGSVRVTGADGSPRPIKPGTKLRAGDAIVVTGKPAVTPLRAEPEAIPLDIVYEDEFVAVIDKPAGMMVHAGSGATDAARNRGTLVNALLHHMAALSTTGGDLRPGIVHRLDKQTSGLIIVAKDDRTHRRLSEMFARREVHKTYLALVHGAVKLEQGTLNVPISRDQQRRTRMTTRRSGGRTAISHYSVLERIEAKYGKFTLLEVTIETGRTHQIRVHLSSIGHPVVGDTLYGAPREILPQHGEAAARKKAGPVPDDALALDRNFLHAARLRLRHPQSGEELALEAPLPAELEGYLRRLSAGSEVVLTHQKSNPTLVK